MRESGEDYLETIYLLNKKLNGVHAVDIANELGYSKPSVTRALNILKSKNLILSDENNHIILTEQGKVEAENIYLRHQLLTKFLLSIGVSKQNANADACRMEHVMCEESLQCIKNFMDKNQQS